MGHELRAEYAEEFKEYEPIAILASLPRCRKRTHASILASGIRALNGRMEQKNEPFKGVAEFSRLWYHDIAKHPSTIWHTLWPTWSRTPCTGASVEHALM